MGFDNDCIPNIQSLAGEYFCPVCRLLVYPNEALQSQCTHLYCKPCLTYVVSTTRACPYDGYLVTEADSKPLTESNKALAETIGKITVHCLYNRSGCTWQGTLTDSTSHCSGCAFGNSPVVCNRCGLQIVHRQVHEHAHTCSGVHSQAQPTVAQTSSAAGTATTGDQSQVNAQTVAISSQAGTSQTAALKTPGQDPNQKINLTTQAQTSLPAAAQTAEVWYQQQQQQYQQYYQQYPGYDPYQQYYPYQQQAVTQYPQSQPQVQMQSQVPQSQPHLQVQPQVQPQSYPQVQQPVAAQPQNTGQQQIHHAVQPQGQAPLGAPLAQPQGQAPIVAPPAHAQLHPLSQPQMPAAQYQQPLQIQHSQSQFQLQTQTQPNIQAQAIANAHLQTFSSQSMNPNLQTPLQHQSAQLVTGHQSYPHMQIQSQQQMQTGVAQPPVHMLHPGAPQPQQSVQMQSQLPQQPTLLRPHDVTQSVPQPNMIPLQALAQPHQPVHSQALGISGNQHHIIQTDQHLPHMQYIQQQQQPVLSGPSLGPVQSQAPQQGPYSQLRPQALLQLMQQPPQAFPQQRHDITGKPMMPSHRLGMQPYVQSSADVQNSAQAGVNHTSEKGVEAEISNKKDVKQATDVVDAAEVNTIKPEIDPGFVNHQVKPEGDSKDTMESNAAEKQVKREHGEAGLSGLENNMKKDIKTEPLEDPNVKLQSGGLMLPSHSIPVVGQGKQQPFAPQQRPLGSQLLQTTPPGHHVQFPGNLPTHDRPLGAGFTSHLGPALHPQSEHLQQPLHKQPHRPETFPGGMAGPGSAPPFGRFPGDTESFPRLNVPVLGLRDDKFRPLADEHINSFSSDFAHRTIDQGGIEDIKHFPRPSHVNTDKAHGFCMDIALRHFEKGPQAGSLGGVPPSRFFPPYELGERDTAQILPDYLGPYGRRHLDVLAPRSPGRDYLGVSSRGFPVRGLNDIDGKDSIKFNDPTGNAFHDSRYPAPFSLRGEFDGPGRDGLPNHLPRGDPFGSRNLQSHLQLGNIPGPGNFRGPRLGEPGFRSSFSQKGFPGDAERFTGNLGSFENSRKRGPPSMGWCRLCKVDCETVEGLDLHSQTSEHQKMAMDMVITIKQNAKKHKLASSDRSAVEDGSKSKAASVEGSGKED